MHLTISLIIFGNVDQEILAFLCLLKRLVNLVFNVFPFNTLLNLQQKG